MRSRQLIVRAKGLLIEEHERPHEVYRVLSGWGARIKLLANGSRQILSFDLPGDFLAPELLAGNPVRFTKVALTQMTLCAFPRDMVAQSLAARSQGARFLEEIWEDRVHMLERQIMMVGRMHAAARICSLLMDIHDRLVDRGLVHDQSFEFPLRHEDLADALGLTTAHVSRTLSALRNEKLVELKGGRALLIDAPGMRRAAH